MAEAPAPGFVPREVLLAMSGLEALQEMIAGRLPIPPMAATMGFRLVEAGPGRAVFEGAARAAAHANPMGGVHGGWYGALLDSALGCAVMSTLPRGRVYTTLDYAVRLVRALPFDTPVRAVAEVDHAGRSTAAARGRVTSPDGARLYATGTTGCLILDPG